MPILEDIGRPKARYLFILLFLFNDYNKEARKAGIGGDCKMITIAEIRMILAEHKNEIVEKYGVKEIGVFGSYLREEQKETSDVDILVEFKRPVGMLTFINLKIIYQIFLGSMWIL